MDEIASAVQIIREGIEKNELPFSLKVFSTPEALSYMREVIHRRHKNLLTFRNMSRWLRQAGFINYKWHKQARGLRVHHSAWFKGNREEFDKVRKILKK